MLATAAVRLRPDSPAARYLPFSKPPAEEPRDTVTVSLYLQDPEADKRIGPQPFEVPADVVRIRGDHLEGPHFTTVNDRAPRTLALDEDGDLIYPAHSREFDMVNAHVHAEGTVAMFERLLGKPITFDHFGDPRVHRVAIKVDRFSKDGPFGYTDGKRMILDWYPSRELGREVRSAESAEMVAHETAHFVLHALRPRLDDKDKETLAFHEAFSDIGAMLYALQFDGNVERMASQTGGNWRRNNVISKFCEEYGKGIQLRHYPGMSTRHDLRSALNDFAYQPPHQTPESEEHYSNNVISPEAHDFSAILTGALYDAITAITDREVGRGASLEDAIRTARDRMGEIWAETIQHLPRKRIRFTTVAARMVEADRALGGGQIRLLREVFRDRGLL